MPLTIVDLTTSSPPFGIPTGSRLLADTVLRNSIETAPIDQLRLTLYAICSESTTATATARSLLVTPRGSLNKEDNPNRESSANEEEEDDDEDDESDTEEDDEDEEDEEDEEEETAKTRTRKTPRALVCRLCLEDYNVNSKGRSDECITHPGDKEADWDSDVWCDWDEDCHGRIEDQGDEFPAGFTYTCCGEPGDAEGCGVGRHEEYVGHGRPYKRVRY